MFPTLLANSIAADAGLIPGFAIFGPAMGLPLSVLAAFIERPFFARAGVRSKTIWQSLQANFLSLLVGYVATLVIIPLVMNPNGEVIGIIWPFGAIAVSVVTERQFVQMRNRHLHVTWGPVVAGNILSAAVCIATLVLAAWMRQQFPGVCVALRPYEFVMNLVVAAASLLLLMVSFAVTPKSDTTRDGT